MPPLRAGVRVLRLAMYRLTRHRGRFSRLRWAETYLFLPVAHLPEGLSVGDADSPKLGMR